MMQVETGARLGVTLAFLVQLGGCEATQKYTEVYSYKQAEQSVLVRLGSLRMHEQRSRTSTGWK